ncbi:short-chain dehydrogenase [Lipomyces tetrasporus]|uniref:Short-chain dehydrogenase n=1 Tax=Lipomyces tetrasporus TaxID=54092 RepID=A0AAD7QKZ5_9ASCO|nr:short-chain dehydrogenase [Lipomyces tetrasporus]KAJ8097205.1 short-chain dehydrogenase [Lipomyces tetrasporus]
MPLIVDFIDRQFIHNNPPAPTASFKGRIAIVTGSNVGLGREAVRLMVRLGASQVIIACRNVEKGKLAAKDIQSTTGCSPDTLKVWQLDMGSYNSVIAFADRVRTELPRLDALAANAGIGTLKFKMTEDNEETITTNVVSMTLLACLVYPKLRLFEFAKFRERKAPAGKIFATLADESKSHMSDRYDTSKLLAMIVVKQLAAMAPIDSNKVIVNCVAPGFCQSDLFRDYSGGAVRVMKKILGRPTEVGARTIVHGTCAGPESHGQYVPDCKIKPTGGLMKGKQGAKLQNRVWAELKQKLEVIQPGVTSLGFET